MHLMLRRPETHLGNEAFAHYPVRMHKRRRRVGHPFRVSAMHVLFRLVFASTTDRGVGAALRNSTFRPDRHSSAFVRGTDDFPTFDSLPHLRSSGSFKGGEDHDLICRRRAFSRCRGRLPCTSAHGLCCDGRHSQAPHRGPCVRALHVPARAYASATRASPPVFSLSATGWTWPPTPCIAHRAACRSEVASS
jgi:hypothetical protein